MNPALRQILGRPFSPAHLPRLVAWWDACDTASVWADTNGTPAAPGGLVRCWKDKVSGIAADQPTGGYQPTLVNGGIGARSIQFAGLHALDVPALPVVRCGVVVHRTNAGTRACLIGCYPLQNLNFEVHTSGGGKARFYYHGIDQFSTSLHSTGAAVLSSWVSGTVGVPGGWGFYKNGAWDGGVSPSGTEPASTAWKIGADFRSVQPALAIPLNGYLAEIVLLAATPPPALLAKLHAYLIRKWSIA